MRFEDLDRARLCHVGDGCALRDAHARSFARASVRGPGRALGRRMTGPMPPNFRALERELTLVFDDRVAPLFGDFIRERLGRSTRNTKLRIAASNGSRSVARHRRLGMKSRNKQENHSKEKGPRNVTVPEALFVWRLIENHFRKSQSSVSLETSVVSASRFSLPELKAKAWNLINPRRPSGGGR